MSRRLPMASNGNGGGGGGPSTPSNHSVRSSSGAPRVPPPSLLCNRCNTPLATTCFLCACDCIFCEGEFECLLDSCFRFQLFNLCRSSTDFLTFFWLLCDCLFLLEWLFVIILSTCSFGDFDLNQIAPTAILKIARSVPSVRKLCETMISQNSLLQWEMAKQTISRKHLFKRSSTNNQSRKEKMQVRPFLYQMHVSL